MIIACRSRYVASSYNTCRDCPATRYPVSGYQPVDDFRSSSSSKHPECRLVHWPCTSRFTCMSHTFFYTISLPILLLLLLGSLSLYYNIVIITCACPVHEQNQARDRGDRNYGRFTFSGHTWLVPLPTPPVRVSISSLVLSSCTAAPMLCYIGVWLTRGLYCALALWARYTFSVLFSRGV